MIIESVNGKTSIFGVIGNPIEHTFSPAIQNTFGVATNKNIMYMPFKVENGSLPNAISGAYALGIKGLNITVPYKKDVIKLLCDIDKKAIAIGAVNTLKYTEHGYVGYNTDITGAYYSLKNRDVTPHNKTVLVLGAGGAANALVVMAVTNGAKKVIIANRTLDKANELKNHVNKYYNTEIQTITLNDINTISDSCEIIMNATTLGFGDKEGQSPISDTTFFDNRNIEVVFDAIYSPWETKLLSDAHNKGIMTINGFDMLVYQAVAAQEIWFEEVYSSTLTENLKNQLATYYKEH